MADGLTRTFGALADPVRRGVVELLRAGPLRPSEIAEALSLSRPATSRHLRVLREARLVSEQVEAEDARARRCRLERAALSELEGWLAEVQAFWGDQLASFKAHAERKGRRRGR